MEMLNEDIRIFESLLIKFRKREMITDADVEYNKKMISYMKEKIKWDYAFERPATKEEVDKCFKNIFKILKEGNKKAPYKI